MKNILLIALTILLLTMPQSVTGCSMYKITKNGKTIVGNNEDYLSPNNQFWYEKGKGGTFGVMYMGLLNKFAQGAINEAGLVFDGFANPHLPVENTVGKSNIFIGDAIRKVMQSMRTVEEVKNYFETINLSSLSSSQLVFVDQSGTYLIVEGDELLLGNESEKSFSNFYYSQVESLEEVELDYFRKGMSFINANNSHASFDFCGQVMQSFSADGAFGTQYSTIYDLNDLKVRVYLFHDYSQFVEIDLKDELSKEDHAVMIADLFPENSIGHQHYTKYNDKDNPTRFLEELMGSNEQMSEADLISVGFNSITNVIGYEWLEEKNNPKAAIKIFLYSIKVMPTDADLYDSLGEAYMFDKQWGNAKTSYERSLTLDPSNENARKKLVEIDKKR